MKKSFLLTVFILSGFHLVAQPDMDKDTKINILGKTYQNIEKMHSLNLARDDQGITISPIINIKFTGDFESYGYYHPVKFEENNRFGYYPQNEEARYKKIEMFNVHFARFTLEDGRKGWLDLKGNEYIDK